MKSVVGMSNISAMMSTISVRSPHQRQHQHQPPPCRRQRGTGTFGNHQPALSIVHGPDTTTLYLGTAAHGHAAFQHLQKPRAGEWRDVVKNCAPA